MVDKTTFSDCTVSLTHSLCNKIRGLFIHFNKFVDLLSSSLLSKKLKTKMYRTIILSVVLYGCETWSLTLREERRLRVFENRMLRRVFGPKRNEVTGEWKNYIMRSLVICTP